MNKNNMNDTSKIASAINDLENVKIPVKIDGENKTIIKIKPVNGHDGMYFFEVAEFVMPFNDNYDVCLNAVNDFLNKKTEVKKTEVKKVVNTRKNKYFYEHVPSFKMNKKEIKNTLGLIAKGIEKFPFKLNQDFMVNGFNYLTENQKNEVATASRKFYNENKRKHIEMTKNEFFAINDAKLILKYL